MEKSAEMFSFREITSSDLRHAFLRVRNVAILVAVCAMVAFLWTWHRMDVVSRYASYETVALRTELVKPIAEHNAKISTIDSEVDRLSVDVNDLWWAEAAINTEIKNLHESDANLAIAISENNRELTNRVAKLEEAQTQSAQQAIVEEPVVEVVEVVEPVEETVNCVHPGMVVYLQYVLMDSLPIPLDALVEYVSVCDRGDVAIKWEEEIGYGQVTHYYVFEEVRTDFVAFTNPGEHGGYDVRYPEPGNVGKILEYHDFYGSPHSDETATQSDGVVDWLSVVQIREWDPVEQELLKLNAEFYNDAVEEGWIYVDFVSDCSPSYYLMNGFKAEPGPYGFTYKVPAEGGKFEAYYEVGAACGGNDEPFVRWSFDVMPGDSITGTERVYKDSLGDLDPWLFCNKLDWMVPAWQPEFLSFQLEGECSNLWGKYSYNPLAVMAREGFQRADLRYGDNHAQYWAPFVFRAGEREVVSTMPAHTWEQVDNITLTAEDAFEVTLDENFEPVINLVGGSDLENDIPWYQPGTPIVFVLKDKMDTYTRFEWEDAKMFRVRVVDNTPVLEQAVWTE